jgi:hypothetical protein
LYPICHQRPAGRDGAAFVIGDGQLLGISAAIQPARALLERGGAASGRGVPIVVVNG